MKNWQETHKLFSEIVELREQRRTSALATIVRLKGSGYRQPGAKLLVRDDGTLAGNVSGGCLENDVRERGLSAIKDEMPLNAHYDTGGAEDMIWGMGVGCNGLVDVLIQPSDGALREILEPSLRLLAGDEPFGICTVIEGEDHGRCMVFSRRGVEVGSTGSGARDRVVEEEGLRRLGEAASGLIAPGDETVFVEILQPPPHLIVCGAGDDSIPLVSLADAAGFRVTVIDHRPAYLDKSRFPQAIRIIEARPEEQHPGIPCGRNAYAVVKAHILDQDKGWVERFARQGLPYIGLLGSKARRQEITAGLGSDAVKHVFGPVGLDLGAEGPEQVAISIVAEMMAVQSGRNPCHLRDRVKPIHGGS